jgi:hypothetical protein
MIVFAEMPAVRDRAWTCSLFARGVVQYPHARIRAD